MAGRSAGRSSNGVEASALGASTPEHFKYANGRSEKADVRQRIPAGGQKRAVDLRGDERAIDGLEFFYAKGRWGYGREPRARLYVI